MQIFCMCLPWKFVILFNFFLGLVFLLKCDSSCRKWHLSGLQYCFHWYMNWIVMSNELFLYREEFITLCLEFQKEIDKVNDDELRALLLDKEFLEDEILLLEKKNSTLKNSMLAFVEEILEDLHTCNSGKIIAYFLLLLILYICCFCCIWIKQI